MKKLSIALLSITVLFMHGCQESPATSGTPAWREPHAGVWTTSIGTPEKINLLNASGAQPRTERLELKSKADFPIDPTTIHYDISDGKTYIRIPLERDEQIYGLGLAFQSINRRGQILRLHMDHYGNGDNGRTHAPVPFFVSSRGYGLFINTARYLDIYAGTGVRLDSADPAIAQDRNTDPKWAAMPYSDNLEILIPAEGVELVMFGGKNMLDAVSRFNLYCGGGFIPPKWGLGFWQRTPTLYNEQAVEKEVAEFAENDFPLDVIGLEPGWHSKAYPCSFDWDSTRFPTPERLIDGLDKQGVKVNLWCNPYLAPETKLHSQMKPYVGTHTVWCGTVPDYTIPAAQDLFKQHITQQQLDKGVSGYKIDEVDGFDFWLFPDVAQFPSGISGEQMRSLYGNLVMETIDQAYKAKNRRTYGLVRAVNGGGVRFPYVIYNDNYSHRDFITALANSGFSGVLWTPEVRASGSSEEWLRRVQTTCLSPIAMINAWADGTKPWSFPDVYENCKKAAYLRMQLLPYLYSIFADYYLNGTPPFRAMNLERGFNGEVRRTKGKLDATENPYEMVRVTEVRDQYMAGNNIIAAPIFAGESSREVVLPAGKWYDFYTGELVGEAEIIRVEAQVDRMPMFVRDGGIVPMIPPIRQTSQWRSGQPLEVRIYGLSDGEFDLYDDDGESYDYQKGSYTLRKLKVTGGTPTVENMVDNGGWSYNALEWKFMTAR